MPDTHTTNDRRDLHVRDRRPVPEVTMRTIDVLVLVSAVARLHLVGEHSIAGAVDGIVQRANNAPE